MTRFEQWIAQHNSRVDLVCKADFRWFCEDAYKGRCILYPVCEKYKFANELGKEFIEEAEAYLDEEVTMISTNEQLKQDNTGEWVSNKVGVYRCSNCHSNMTPKKGKMPKYCDECGFKMLNGGTYCGKSCS